jgi:hypothetical protein
MGPLQSARGKVLRTFGVASAIALLSVASACRATGPSTPATTGATPASAGASSSPSPTPSTSPTPTTPPTDPAIVFAADGIGGYTIGTALTDLQSRAMVTNITESPFCADAKGADATGVYAGKVTLTFRTGRLTAVHTLSTVYVTPSGGKVGMLLTDLQSIYASRGTLITGNLGNKAFSVRVPASGLGIVFYLDSTNTKVAAMSGGDAQALEDAARNGEGC